MAKRYGYKSKTDKSPTTSSGANFAPLPTTGFYVVEVSSAKLAEYSSKKTGVNYLKVTPSMKVVAGEKHHTINRFDINISAVTDDGSFYRPDGDSSKEPIWFLADSFFQSMGVYSVQEDGTSDLNLDTDFMRGRVVKALFRYETYCKADSAWTFRSDDLDTWLKTEQGYTDADLLEIDLEELIGMLNEVSAENGYADEENIRVKSVPVKFWAMSAAQAEQAGYFVLTEAYFTPELGEGETYELSVDEKVAMLDAEGITFITEDAYNTFTGLQALVAFDDDDDGDLGLQL